MALNIENKKSIENSRTFSGPEIITCRCYFQGYIPVIMVVVGNMYNFREPPFLFQVEFRTVVSGNDEISAQPPGPARAILTYLLSGTGTRALACARTRHPSPANGTTLTHIYILKL